MKRIFLMLILLFELATPIYARKVYINGETIAISLNYDGVVIGDTYILNTNGTPYVMSKFFNKDDVIIGVDGVLIHSIEELKQVLVESDEPTFEVIRNGEKIQVSINGDIDYSQISNGLYLKDRVSGIGTITYFDPNTNMFGALGHALVNNTEFIEQNSGVIYSTDIFKISKSSEGVVGEKIADTSTLIYLGDVTKANEYGVYGVFQYLPDDVYLIDTASKEEVHVGNAQILTQLDNNSAVLYDIYIEEVKNQRNIDIKGLKFRVTNQELLTKAGGIVQGMSGSPIIQDGKLVGAVTHVLVNDPTRGYGIFIENMLDVAE